MYLTKARKPRKALRPILERDIEAYLVRSIKHRGGQVRKVRFLDRNGAPDRVLMLPESIARAGDVKTVWVELKAPGKGPKPHQLREHQRMRAAGQFVVVIDSFEGVDALLFGVAS